MNIHTFFSIPKSLYYNLKLLPFNVAIKMPLYVDNSVKIILKGSLKSKIKINSPIKTGMIQLGKSNGSFNQGYGSNSYLYIDKCASIVFEGPCQIGRGFKFMSCKSGSIVFGKNVHLNSFSMISSNGLVKLEEGVRTGWCCTIIDWDGHDIVEMETGKIVNNPRPIIIKKHTWLGSHVTILKGVTLEHHSIVPYGSIISKSNDIPISVFGGNPNRVLKLGVIRKDKYDCYEE